MEKKKMTVTFDDLNNEIMTYEKNEINEINEKDEINQEINLEDYELAEEEQELFQYLNLINIFNVYYKARYRAPETATLFEGIDFEDDTSTNRALEIFYEELNNYKKAEEKEEYDLINLFDEEEYALLTKNKEDIPLYNVIINENEKKVTHNLITAILFVSGFDWINCSWSIVQINLNN